MVLVPIWKKLLKTNLERIEKRAIRRNKTHIKFIIKLVNTKIVQVIIEALFVTISASLTTAPIILVGFNKINITNLVIGIFSSFIIGPIMIVGLLFIITKASFIEKILSLLLKILEGGAKLGAKLPLNQIYFITPNDCEILIYYILIFTVNFLIKIRLEKNQSAFQKRVKNLLSLLKYKINSNKNRIISIILIVSLIYSFVIIIPKNLNIYFVDVGQRRLFFNCNS